MLFIILSFVLIASQWMSTTQGAFLRDDELDYHGRRFMEPCSVVNEIYADNMEGKNASETIVTMIPMRLAYGCVMSVPLVKEDALRLMDAISAMLEWQSSLAYLKSPPPGYHLEAADLVTGLQEVRDAVVVGHIDSEYAFQEHLNDLFGDAHDGHLSLKLDIVGVFWWYRPWADLVALSANGRDIPQIFFHEDILAQKSHKDFEPSPITRIDGQQVQDWLRYEAWNRTSPQHDPDAMYNALFRTPASDGLLTFPPYYPDISSTISFKNGSTQTYMNKAFTIRNFTGVTDGQSFYDTFIRAELAGHLDGLNIKARVGLLDEPQNLQDPETGVEQTEIDPYPAPVQLSRDDAVAGYYVDTPGFEDVAVLKIQSFAPESNLEFQSTLAKFLDMCVAEKKKYLIIDVQTNIGGNIGLGYDAFSQLFPTVESRAPGNYRAHEQLSVLGSFLTQHAWEEWNKSGDFRKYQGAGGYTMFDARAFNDDNGNKFESWDDLYGPISAHGDTFTNRVLPNVTDPNYQRFMTGNVFNLRDIQPFSAENVIVLGDGHCSSTCDTFLHQLKWQAGVKTIVAGGLPSEGPAQSVGGAKARRKLTISSLNDVVRFFYENAPDDLRARADETKLKVLREDGDYLETRSRMSVNVGNAILAGDETFTPLQFVYEAADCKLWWQAEHIFNVTSLWALVAETAFGLNGGQKWEACVPGSTGHPSSVSGGKILDFPSKDAASGKKIKSEPVLRTFASAQDPGSKSAVVQTSQSNSALRGCSVTTIAMGWMVYVLAVWLGQDCQ